VASLEGLDCIGALARWLSALMNPTSLALTDNLYFYPKSSFSQVRSAVSAGIFLAMAKDRQARSPSESPSCAFWEEAFAVRAAST